MLVKHYGSEFTFDALFIESKNVSCSRGKVSKNKFQRKLRIKTSESQYSRREYFTQQFVPPHIPTCEPVLSFISHVFV